MIHMAHYRYNRCTLLDVKFQRLILKEFNFLVELKCHCLNCVLRQQLKLIRVRLSTQLLQLFQDHVGFNIKHACESESVCSPDWDLNNLVCHHYYLLNRYYYLIGGSLFTRSLHHRCMAECEGGLLAQGEELLLWRLATEKDNMIERSSDPLMIECSNAFSYHHVLSQNPVQIII